MLGDADVALLRDFLEAMERAQAKCFLVGAGARILTFDQRWDLRNARTTSDWDFAMRAASWPEWKRITSHLLAGSPPKFRAGKTEHKFFHIDGGQLDLVPYGGLESPPGEIVWPGASRMSVAGFLESETRCESVSLESGLTIPVAALPSLAVLKLHAYRDRRQRSVRKDIQDFDWFLENYAAAGNEVRIYEDLADALNEDRIDIGDAGAALLGLDVAITHDEAELRSIRDILDEARDPWSTLIADVVARRHAFDDDRTLRQRDEASRRFAAFEFGVELGLSRRRV